MCDIELEEELNLGCLQLDVQYVNGNDDYEILLNKPKINGVELIGDKDSKDLLLEGIFRYEGLEGLEPEIGDIIQYIGETDDSFVNGYFYKYNEDSEWENISVQSVISDHSLLSNLDYDNSGHIGFQRAENAYNNLIKVKDYLYQIYYDKCDYDFANYYFKNNDDNISIGACSSVRKDNYYGRNLDWFYDNTSEFIIRMPKRNNKYANIGVAGNLSDLTNEFVESREYSELYKILPFHTLDGINEKGVFCNINVVPIKGEPMTHTTPSVEEKEQICVTALPRYIIDSFASADEAIDYLEKYVKIYANEKLQNMGYESHFMIGDSSKTYVLEIINNNIVILEKNYMTNFHLDGVVFNEDGTVYTPANVSDGHLPSVDNNIEEFGSGLERFNLIVNNYDNLETKADMRGLMDKLLYTRTYPSCTLPDGVANPFWYTEYVGDGEHGTFTVDSLPNEFNNIIPIYDELYVNRTREEGNQTWQTVNSSVYDINEKKLYVVVQEDGIELEFNFDYYYTAEEIDEKLENKQNKLIAGENITISENNVISASGGGNVDDVLVNGESVVENKIANVTVPTKTSDLQNDSNFVSDSDYVHTDNNFTDAEKTKLAGLENYDDTGVWEAISEHDRDIQNIENDIDVIEQDIDDLGSEIDSLEINKVNVSDIINDVNHTDINKPLSANMGKELQDQITILKSRGRYLSVWNCTTGLAETTPTVDPYVYRAGDYFIVGVVGTTNYRPNGSTYSESTPSTTIETEDVKVNDTYYYDGTTWTLLDVGQISTTFGSLAGDPYDNSNLASALNDKVGFTDYATFGKGGTLKKGSGLNLNSNGGAYAETYDYATYNTKDNGSFISKGTLENVIEGKELENKIEDVQLGGVSIIEDKIANILKAVEISSNSSDDKLVTEKALYDYIASGNDGDARLLSQADLDYIYNTGFYFCNMCNHRPVNANGILIVSKIANGTNYAAQIYLAFAEDKVFARFRDNNAWKSWVKLADVNDLTNYVEKETGKGLSSNDYTDEEQEKLAGIEVGAEVNDIDTIQVQGETQPITNKTVNLDVPTRDDIDDLVNIKTNTTGYIEDALEYRTFNKIIDGNSKQETTEGKNLFDETNMYNGYYEIANGSLTPNNAYRTLIIDNLPSGIYTFSTTLNNCRLMRYWADNVSHDIQQDKTNYTLTTTTNGKVMLCFRNQSSTEITETFNTMLEQGSTATSYEPYTGGQPSPSPDYPQEIEVIDELGIKVTGKNFIKLSNCTTDEFKIENNVITSLITSDNFHLSNYLDSQGILHRGSQNYANYEPFNENRRYMLLKKGTYRLNFSSSLSGERMVMFLIDEEYANNNYSHYTVPNENKKRYYQSQTITIDRDMYMYIFVCVGTSIFTLSDFQVEQGSTATAYEPYQSKTTAIDLQDEFVGKIPNGVKDEVHIDKYGNVSLLKKIGKVVLDGSETYTKVRDYIFSIDLLNAVYPTNETLLMNCLCNYYERVSNSASWNNFDYMISYYSSKKLVFRNKDTQEITDFQTWLSTHNTEVYYELETPYTVNLGNIGEINTYKGINNIDIIANLDTTFSVEYAGEVDQPDLTDYVKNTDYATASKGGVIKIGASGETFLSSEKVIYPAILTYEQYEGKSPYLFISKNTLENVITGKHLDRPEVLTTLGATAEVNTLYDLGEQSTLAITLPNGQLGDFIEIDFLSGSTATNLTITSAYGMSDFDIVPEVNTGYSIYCSWAKLDSTTYGWVIKSYDFVKATI